jgi:hypothetical protein
VQLTGLCPTIITSKKSKKKIYFDFTMNRLFSKSMFIIRNVSYIAGNSFVFYLLDPMCSKYYIPQNM